MKLPSPRLLIFPVFLVALIAGTVFLARIDFTPRVPAIVWESHTERIGSTDPISTWQAVVSGKQWRSDYLVGGRLVRSAAFDGKELQILEIPAAFTITQLEKVHPAESYFRLSAQGLGQFSFLVPQFIDHYPSLTHYPLPSEILGVIKTLAKPPEGASPLATVRNAVQQMHPPFWDEKDGWTAPLAIEANVPAIPINDRALYLTWPPGPAASALPARIARYQADGNPLFFIDCAQPRTFPALPMPIATVIDTQSFNPHTHKLTYHIRSTIDQVTARDVHESVFHLNPKRARRIENEILGTSTPNLTLFERLAQDYTKLRRWLSSL